jgi:formate hydrogenlyase subunit 5
VGEIEMKGRLPLGPFDIAVRQPLLLECRIEDAVIVEAEVTRASGELNLELAFEGATPLEGAEIASQMCARSGVHHATAFCAAVEDAAGVEVPGEHSAMRVVLAEWARIASHLEVISDIARSIEDDLAYARPRRYIKLIRDGFASLCSNPFAFGAVVPGGVRIEGDMDALDRLDEVGGTLARDTRFWARKLGLSRARLSAGRLTEGALPEGHPPAAAFRAGGSRSDLRAGEAAAGHYTELAYRPVVRDGGSALDRALVLLSEIDSSLGLVAKARELSRGYSGAPAPVASGGKGSGVGVCESPHGGLEYRVFLGSEGKIMRVRAASAAEVTAEMVGHALRGVPFEDAVPAYVSLDLCAACMRP